MRRWAEAHTMAPSARRSTRFLLAGLVLLAFASLSYSVWPPRGHSAAAGVQPKVDLAGELRRLRTQLEAADQRLAAAAAKQANLNPSPSPNPNLHPNSNPNPNQAGGREAEGGGERAGCLGLGLGFGLGLGLACYRVRAC